MKIFNTKLGVSWIAVAVFVVIMLFLSLYFFIRLSKNQQGLEQQGFRSLNQLALAMKEKDTVIRKVVLNSKFPQQNNPTRQFGESSIKKHLYLSTVKPASEPLDSLVYTYEKDSLCTINIKDFITPLLSRKEFFSHYVLLRNDTIVFNTLGGDAILSKDKFKKVEQQNSLLSFSSISEKSYGDSVLFIQAGFVQKVTIQGKNYLFFAIPLKLNSKPDWYLGGLVEEKTFLSWKRNLPSEVIGIFALILLSIIFSFPVLKVFLSGPLEKLSRIGVTLTGISLIFGPILIVILMSEVLLSNKLKNEHFGQLNALNESVKEAFSGESEAILKQLKAYRNAGFDKKELPVTSILDSNLEVIKPYHYKFFNAFFPADNEGNQILYITTQKKGEKSNVMSRDYFLHPDKYKKTIQGETMWYNMEPIYSNTTGDWSIAFSTPSGKPDSSKIVAITSSMYSLKNPVLPDGYSFYLVEKSGRVWYDSDELLNLSDNFIIEANNDSQLPVALESNATSNFKVKLRNQKHFLHISPIGNTELFMITVFNPARTNALEALVTTYAIGFFAILLVLIVLLVLILKMFRIKTSKLKGTEYFFSWLTPKKSKAVFYKFMLIFNGTIFLIMVILSITNSFTKLSVNSFIWFFMVFIILHYSAMFLIRTVLKKTDRKNTDSPKTTEGYLKGYTYFLFSWLIATSILPALFLMSRFAQEEGKFYAIQQQQDLAHKINSRNDLLTRFFNENYEPKVRSALLKERNQQGLYFEAISGLITPPEKAETLTNTDFLQSKYLKLVRSNYQQMMGQELTIWNDLQCQNQLYEDSNSKIMMVFDKVSYQKSGLKKTESDTLVSANVGKGMYKPFENGKWKWNVALFWLFFVLVMLFVYSLINKIVRRLFPYGEICSDAIDAEKLFEVIKKSKKNAVIVSIRKADKQYIMDHLFNYVDLADAPSKNLPANKNIIILNFEKGINDPVDLEKKLTKLDQFLKQKPAILWLGKTPAQFVNYYQELWKNEANPGIFKSHLRHFERLVSELPVFYILTTEPACGKQPVIHEQKEQKSFAAGDEEFNRTAIKNGNDTGIRNEQLKSIFLEEGKFNPGIVSLEPILALSFEKYWNLPDTGENQHQKKAKDRAIEEEFILKIQELSFTFYKGVWNSLSKEEQFVLFDLAEDSIVNMNNREIIKSLINKGILKLNDTMEISSRGFRNFVLTKVDKTELEAMQKQIEMNGNWSRMRIPLILVAASIAVFLFVTQQNFLSNLNTFLLSALTIAGTFLRFSGLFTKGKAG